MAEASETNETTENDGERPQRRESWWDRFLRSIGHVPGENNDTGLLRAVRDAATPFGSGWRPGPDNDTGTARRVREMFSGGRGARQDSGPIFSDGLENGNDGQQRGGRGAPNTPGAGGWSDNFSYLGDPNSRRNSDLESIYNSPTFNNHPGGPGNASNGGSGNDFGRRFNYDGGRNPSEAPGGGGSRDWVGTNVGDNNNPGDGSTGGGGTYTPPSSFGYIPQRGGVGGAPMPQYMMPFSYNTMGGTQLMPSYNTFDYPQYPQQGGGQGNGAFQSHLQQSQMNNPGVYGAPSGDIYRGGQNPSLGRYRPPTLSGSGNDPNQWNDYGGYSYNLPNSFGPFPQFNSNYAQGFGGMWGGLESAFGNRRGMMGKPWGRFQQGGPNQQPGYSDAYRAPPPAYGGDPKYPGVAVGEQNPSTPPGFPTNSKPAVDPYYTSKPEMNAPIGPVVDTGYFTGQQTDPTIPTMPVFSNR